MPKKIKPLTFDEVISRLRSRQFDVRPAPMDSKGIRVSKYNCAAELGPDANDRAVLLHNPGILLGGEIAALMDRGFQKFFKTSRMEMAATAERLKAEHRFSQELAEATGGVSLYNKSLGTTSDRLCMTALTAATATAPRAACSPGKQRDRPAHTSVAAALLSVSILRECSDATKAAAFRGCSARLRRPCAERSSPHPRQPRR